MMLNKGLKTKISLVAWFLLWGPQPKAQNFVIHDVLVSDPSARISDTEFDPFKKRMCWQTLDDNSLWICRLDTVTWALLVPDGKETLVDTALVPLCQTSNAAEWGFDQDGTFIVYNKLYGRTRYIAIAAEVGSSWVLSILTDAPHRFNPHATQNPADSVAAIQYVRSNFTGSTKYKLLNAPGTELSISCFTDAHWAENEQLLTGILFNHQVGLYDPASPGIPIQLTSDLFITYSKPYMWRSPE